MRYQPLNLGRWIVWGGTALLMAVLPLSSRRASRSR
jgi:branched-chain amino acid transport system permease protein